MMRAILTGALAVTCFACAVGPRAALPESVDVPECEAMPERDSVDASQAPPDVVHTVKPILLNAPEVDRALQREPRRLLVDGIGGTTTVNLLIDEEGIVKNLCVKESSGYKTLDAAALRIARVARFSPARKGEEAVRVWIELPISFSSRRFGRPLWQDRWDTTG